jgi:hypothetical protein
MTAHVMAHRRIHRSRLAQVLVLAIGWGFGPSGRSLRVYSGRICAEQVGAGCD